MSGGGYESMVLSCFTPTTLSYDADFEGRLSNATLLEMCMAQRQVLKRINNNSGNADTQADLYIST